MFAHQKPLEWKPALSKLQLNLRSPFGILAAFLFLSSGVQSMADAEVVTKIYMASVEFSKAPQIVGGWAFGTTKERALSDTFAHLQRNKDLGEPKIYLAELDVENIDVADVEAAYNKTRSIP